MHNSSKSIGKVSTYTLHTVELPKEIPFLSPYFNTKQVRKGIDLHAGGLPKEIPFLSPSFNRKRNTNPIHIMTSHIFQTPQFTIRPLQSTDFAPFHEMQSNLKVMQYTTGKAQTLEENKADLTNVISHYTKPNNQFWVWAIERRSDQAFIGTCALVGEEKGSYEIGYRFLEKYWGMGYGKLITNALIDYAKKREDIQSLFAYVDVKNIASVRILDQSDLLFIREETNKEMNCIDRFYKLTF